MWVYGKSNGRRKRSKVDTEAQLMFGLRSFLYILFFFFLDEFSSFGRILRFPLQQTPLGTTAKGQPVCQWGGGHLLQIYPSKQEAANLHTVKKDEGKERTADSLSLTKTWGQARALSDREGKPKDDLMDYIMTGGNTVWCFWLSFSTAGVHWCNCVLLKVFLLAQGWVCNGPYAS